MNKLNLTLALALFFGGTTAAQACAMYRRPVKLKPRAVAEVLQQGKRAEARNQLRTAVRHYERAMNAPGAAKQKAQAAFLAARIHLKEGRTARAVVRLRRAVALDAGHVEAHVALGLHAEAKGIPHLETALTLGVDGPRAAELHAVLALKLAKDGRVDDARRHLALAQENGAPIQQVIAAERAIATASTVALGG